VVLALHGGGTTAVYFDCPGRPDLSLLRLGASLGFTVIALDRPGYGSSEAYAEKIRDPARRVEIGFAALDTLLAHRERGAGVFLLAHSAGCELAMRMAADERGRDLIGLEIAGTGLEHDLSAVTTLDTAERDETGRPLRPRGLRAVLWGPSHLYAPDVYADGAIAGPSPLYEAEARHWVDEFPQLAARVRTPVQVSLGDHETVWRSGPAELDRLSSLFTGSPRVRAHEQADGGHNLSLGLTARAYHLRVLSFAEECAVLRETHREMR
jgi:pimeloyl-ACP methyl ester carboxylesterase